MGSKKKKEPIGLPMSKNDDTEANSSNRDEETEIKEIPTPFIHPLNGVSIGSSEQELEKRVVANGSSSQQPGKSKKTILESGGFSDSIIPATYVAETNLPTDIGHFRIRAYRIEEFETALREPHPLGAGAGLGSEPCVIYCTDKPPFGSREGERAGAKEVPVRIHDQCFTSEVFRSQR